MWKREERDEKEVGRRGFEEKYRYEVNRRKKRIMRKKERVENVKRGIETYSILSYSIPF